MKNIAVIPARSGSKGLKDKNIKDFHGKPLLVYSIEAALESGVFDTIMVSTDSEVYAEISRKWGAEVPFLRSAELSKDSSSTDSAIIEALDYYEGRGERFDTVCILQPTSPLRTGKHIREGYQMFEEKGARAVISVCEMDHSPLWSNQIPESGCMNDFISKDVEGIRRQELPDYYRINGALFIKKPEDIRQGARTYSKTCFAYKMDKYDSVDIDTLIDFKLAEVLLTERENLK